mgnify:CR=1 FL=1
MPTDPQSYRSFSSALEKLYQNPNSVSDQTVDRFYDTSDYLEEDSNYKNSSFSLSDFYKEKNNQIEQVKVSSDDESLYGFQAPTWTPDWIKAGYNRSITGMAIKALNGEKIKEYDLNVMEDIGATVISMVQPIDFATGIIGGGVGSLAARQALKTGTKEALKKGLSKTATNKIVAKKLDDTVVKQILKNTPNKAVQIMTGAGIKENIAKKAVEKAGPRVVQRALIEGAKGSTGLGFYQGLSTASYDKVTTGDIDEVKALKETLKGMTLGAVTGASSPVVKSALKNLNPLTQELASKAVETVEFGTLSPVLNGQDINPETLVESYIHAAGVVGGLTAQKKAFAFAKKGIKSIKEKQYDSPMTAETAARYVLESNLPNQKSKKSAQTSRDLIESKEIFVNKYGTKFDNLKFSDRNKQVTLRNAKTKKVDQLNYDQFDELLFRRESKARTVAGLSKSRNRKILKIKDDLGVKDDRFKDYIDAVRLVPLDSKIKNKYSLNSLSGVERLKLLNEMRHEKRIYQLSQNFLNAGWEGSLLPKKRFIDQVLPNMPKVYRQAKNRATTQLEVLSFRDFDNYNVRELTLLGGYLQQLQGAGAFKKGLFKEKKFLEDAKQLADRLEDPRYANPKNKNLPDYKRVSEVRSILDKIWDDANKIGIDLGPKEEFYFPRMIKPEILKIFNSDIAKFGKDNPSLNFDGKGLSKTREYQRLVSGYIKSKEFDEPTVKAIKKIAGIAEDAPEPRTRRELREREKSLAEAFYDFSNNVTVQFSSKAKNLEFARKNINIPKEFLERDARLVLARYAKQASSRIAEVENFGVKGERIYSRISALRKSAINARQDGRANLSKRLEESAKTIDFLFKSATTRIELDSDYNYKSSFAKKFWNNAVDFQIGTKIGLGFATIPNLTQLSISTAIRTGYYPLMKAMVKLSTDQEYRNLVKKSGSTNLSVFQQIHNLEPMDTFFGRFADLTTKATGFQKINEFNQLVSAAAAREWISSLRKTANGKSALLDVGFTVPRLLGGNRISRREWAINTLRELGISDYKKPPTERQLVESMYRFSRDSQLQRNVLNEPLVTQDPRWRPFFLFKKFGYKQFNWVREQLSEEVSRGNLFPMLRLGMAGMAGGEMVSYARDLLSTWISGDSIYDNNRYILPFLPKNMPFSDVGPEQFMDASQLTMDDYLDRFASVGALGIVSDIVANENKVRALEFAFKPAVVQDFQKIWSAMTRTMEDTKTYGLGTAIRIPKYIAPVTGTIPRRFLQRFETKGQRVEYVKRIKALRLTEVRDAIIDGDSQKAVRIIEDYNRTFASENPILYDDYDADAITARIINRIKKRQRNIKRTTIADEINKFKELLDSGIRNVQ